MTANLAVARPWLGDAEAEAVARVIRSGWITQGPEVAAFEREFADYAGAPYACAVSNCSNALYLALVAVGVRPGDDVITVSHSFIATANAVRHCGATPVFVDIQRDTLNIDPTKIAPCITPRTRAILCVHQLGMPCDLATIVRIGRDRGIPVIEDAACAAGSEILWEGHWEHIGKPRGDVACFSFHPRKLLSTGDGGMLTTANEAHDRTFRLLRHQGMSVDDLARHRSSEVIFESYPAVGHNFRLTDVQAAIGRVQLRRLPEIVERRRQLVARYCEQLADVRDVTLPHERDWARSNWQTFAVRLSPDLDQRRVMQVMLDENVETRRGVMCAHREPAYPPGAWRCGAEPCRGCARGACERLRESERAQDEMIVLPLFHEMTADDQKRVVEALITACRTARDRAAV